MTDHRDSLSKWLGILGLIVAGGGLVVSHEAMIRSDETSKQALELSKISNEIALGTKREQGTMIFSEKGDDAILFDLSDPLSLKGDLIKTIAFFNAGQLPASGISAELIGIEPMTYSLSNSENSISPLPSVMWDLNFSSAVLPSGVVTIDMRRPLLIYLKKLSSQLENKESIYNTTLNMVVSTKTIGNESFVGAPAEQSGFDRRLITVKFRPSIIEAADTAAILANNNEPHRVYTR